ncbi:uncharacterized protein LOC131938762 [Physella acuta]|uniref:uncharacterized protein LOC131938762 n=1 Tax=Physella acuta TaxID=109671 RepID=UPI0027DB826E|nr:uncharacterized protein LOC131938762 [Physella acuta]
MDQDTGERLNTPTLQADGQGPLDTHRDGLIDDKPDVQSGDIGRQTEAQSGDIGHQTEVQSGDIGHQTEAQSGDIGHQTEAQSGDIGHQTEVQSGDIGHQTEAQSGDIGHQTEVQSGDIGHQTEAQSGNIGHQTEAQSGNIGHQTEAQSGDIGHQTEVQSGDIGHQTEAQSGDIGHQTEVQSGDIGHQTEAQSGDIGHQTEAQSGDIGHQTEDIGHQTETPSARDEDSTADEGSYDDTDSDDEESDESDESEDEGSGDSQEVDDDNTMPGDEDDHHDDGDTTDETFETDQDAMDDEELERAYRKQLIAVQIVTDDPQETSLDHITIANRILDLSKSLSDYDPNNYDYVNGVVVPDVESDIGDADSWDWTFPDSNVNELDIPPERRNKIRPRKSKRTTTAAGNSSQEKTTHAGNTDELKLTPAEDEMGLNPTTLQDRTSYYDTIYQQLLAAFLLEQERMKLSRESSAENIVYFEDPDSSKLQRKKLKFLNPNSSVASKTKVLTRDTREDGYRKQEVAKQKHSPEAVKHFEQRNVKRILSKLSKIEAHFIGSPKQRDAAVKATDKPTDTVTESSEVMSKPEGMLNSSLKLNSVAERRASLGDTLTERLMQWRWARGRASSRPDVLGKSKTKEELQDEVNAYLASTQQQFEEKKDFLAIFRHAARLTIILLRAVGIKPQKPEVDSYNFLSWTVVYDEVLGISRLNYDSGALTFDPQVFKAKNESTITEETKEILRLPASQRTDGHIHTARICFKQVAPSFSEFPIRIQESMIRVCTYERFEPGRVIIRQGHRAENFYFIISGCAVVTEMDLNANHVLTTNVLGKGNSFGELAILNMALRSATVTCREEVELIWIEREDFIDIFMRGVKGREAEHIAFLKGVDLLQGWPVNQLPQDNPKICAFTYVRRGVTLCRDSCKSDWIFVIVSGSCKILKALYNQPDKTVETPQSVSLAPLASGFSTIYTKGGNRATNIKGSNPSLSHTATGRTTTRVRRQGIVQRPRDLVATIHLLSDRTEEKVSMSRSQHQLEIEELYFRRHVLPSIHTKPSREMHGDIRSTSRVSPQVEARPPGTPSGTSPTSLQLPPISPLYKPKRQSYGLHPPALPQLGVGTQSQRQRKSRKVFIEVARLESGATFGLDQVVLAGMRKLTSCSLVSDGAEVVLINKKFFKKYLTEETLKTIREKIVPLPSEKVLKQDLETVKTWQTFKAQTLAEFHRWRNQRATVSNVLRQH